MSYLRHVSNRLTIEYPTINGIINGFEDLQARFFVAPLILYKMIRNETQSCGVTMLILEARRALDFKSNDPRGTNLVISTYM